MARSIKHGKVNISNQPHFLIFYSEDMGCKDWFPVAVLSMANNTVDEMRLALLVHDIKYLNVVDMVKRELNFYLFKLNNPDPVDYLRYHCQTMSNIYSNIHFNLIEKISKDNIFYYVETESKLLGLHNTVPVSTLQEKHVDIIVNNLFVEALGPYNQFDGVAYNENLIMLHDLCFNGIPTVNNFAIDDPLTLVELSQKLATLDIRCFCNVINYLRKIKLLKLKDVKRMLSFYYLNRKQYQDLERINS